MSFEHLFSRQSKLYAEYRPTYPDALFAWLANEAPSTALAWDCATGTGQAAHGLAAHFSQVVATDASENQIAHAPQHERIEYRVMNAEQVALADSSVDVITVAQALHWFDLESFYREVRRVLKPGGLIAAWCYHLNRIDPAIDAILHRYYFEIVYPYWDPRALHIPAHYATLDFPFDEIETPAFYAETQWTMESALGYMASWSATLKYRDVEHKDPLDLIRADLRAAWGEPTQVRKTLWPLYLRVGKVR